MSVHRIKSAITEWSTDGGTGAALKKKEQARQTDLDGLAPIEPDTINDNFACSIPENADSTLQPTTNVHDPDGWPVIEDSESHHPTTEWYNLEKQLNLPDIASNCLLLSPMEIIAAYTSNATLLQVSCLPPTHRRTFRPFGLSVPSTLAPTPAQTIIPHPSFIDIIPFPGFRNRILHSINVIDLDTLSRDLIHDAFSVWGRDPWDATGWEISERFAKTWWFLVDEELLKTTNFWRSQKSENMLVIGGHGDVSTSS